MVLLFTVDTGRFNQEVIAQIKFLILQLTLPLEDNLLAEKGCVREVFFHIKLLKESHVEVS